MQTTEIKCDQCGNDLTYTGNCEDWRLVLTYEAKAPWFLKEGQGGGVLTAMHIPKPISRTHHFCGLRCMDEWRAIACEKEAKRKAWYDANKEEVGPGIFRMPDLPDELK